MIIWGEVMWSEQKILPLSKPEIKDLDLYFSDGYINGHRDRRRERGRKKETHESKRTPTAAADLGCQQTHLNYMCV